MMNRLLASLCLCLGLNGAPALAQTENEPLDIQLSYDITLNVPGPAITNILTFNHYVDGGGTWWAAEVPAGVTGHTITDPFLKSSANRPLEALQLGLVQDLPNDAPGQKHVVMMMSEAAAQRASGVAWGTLFRNTLEEHVVAAIELATSGQPFNVIEPGLSVLGDFTEGDAQNGILDGLAQPVSAWFSLGAVQPGSTSFSNFTVMAFSDGQVLGQGLASLQTLAPVPEPDSFALALAGLLLLGRALRRLPRD
jgi:hypothetical protein